MVAALQVKRTQIPIYRTITNTVRICIAELRKLPIVVTETVKKYYERPQDFNWAEVQAIFTHVANRPTAALVAMGVILLVVIFLLCCCGRKSRRFVSRLLFLGLLADMIYLHFLK